MLHEYQPRRVTGIEGLGFLDWASVSCRVCSRHVCISFGGLSEGFKNGSLIVDDGYAGHDYSRPTRGYRQGI